MSDKGKEDVYRELLHILLTRVDQLKVKSPGEAESCLLSRIPDANPIKELLLLQSEGVQYQGIEERLRQMLKADFHKEDDP